LWYCLSRGRPPLASDDVHARTSADQGRPKNYSSAADTSGLPRPCATALAARAGHQPPSFPSAAPHVARAASSRPRRPRAAIAQSFHRDRVGAAPASRLHRRQHSHAPTTPSTRQRLHWRCCFHGEGAAARKSRQ
jgi:hypothetical protein